MINITRDNFEAEIKDYNGFVVVDYWGEGCSPCMALMPDFESLESKYEGKVKFAKINTTQERKLALSQRVLGLPTIVLYQNGERAGELTKDRASLDGIDELLRSLV
ncbi:MAG: thioredoxin 1 [Clostridiales bacterium]|jgi:thioredoxin 1|nr:thioredoxin 1 [Clostridiales bacterium]